MRYQKVFKKHFENVKIFLNNVQLNNKHTVQIILYDSTLNFYIRQSVNIVKLVCFISKIFNFSIENISSNKCKEKTY